MIYDCDLCGSSEYEPIEAARPYIGNQEPPVVCTGCGFVYVRERRSPQEIARAWDDIWGNGYTSQWPAVKARLTYVTEWIDQTIGLKGKSVLDIGAGEGTFLEMVRQKGAYPVGIEPSGENVMKIHQKDIACFHGTVESISGPIDYDIVTVLWTLENTGDCIGFLRKARTFVKQGGHIVVATGSRILVPFKKPISTYFSKNPQDTHCFRFTANSLLTALHKAGFSEHAANRYQDSDWLVMKVRNPMVVPKSQPDYLDNSSKVLRFFNSWAEQFP